jgi:hypothetical protein
LAVPMNHLPGAGRELWPRVGMTPATYFRELVEPAIEEFEAEPISIRHAYTACMFAYHFADAVHVARREPKDGIRKAIAALAKWCIR